MTILDADKLAALDPAEVRDRKPFPWLHVEKLITDQGYRRLLDSLPDKSEFDRIYGKRRPGGQKPHNRYALQYKPWKSYPEPWAELIAELNGPLYKNFVANVVGHNKFLLHCHWHYTPVGCSVSPHTDAPWKYGSHIFYLNTEDDWDEAWGGNTVVLDDGGRFKVRSAPKFEDFDREISAPSMGNRSLFFARNDHSWHGVKELNCPEDKLRKVFIVEIRKPDPIMALRTRLGF